MRAIDTNVLVRALVRDDPAQSARAEQLLAAEEVLYVPVTVVLELEWVLRSRYGYPPRLVARALQGLAALGNVVLGERAAVVAAAAQVAQGWDFADALHHALSAGCADFVTLDTTLKRLAARGTLVTPAVTQL